jgi:RecA-family ATPase
MKAELGQYAQGFASFRKLLSAVPDTSRVAVFSNAAAEAASYVAKGLDRTVAADELADMAVAHGLDDADAVQWIISKAFERIEQRERVPDDIQAPGKSNGKDRIEPLSAFAASVFSGVEAPPRRWSVVGRIPMRNVTLLAGDGATGKTTIALQLAVVCASNGNDWLGAILGEHGPVFFLTAEEERDEVHYRLTKIANHYGVDFATLHNLHIHCAAGEDCVLGNVNRLGVFTATAFHARLKYALATIRPKLVILESSADLYGGNENDRASVRQFIRLLRAIAIEFDCAVVLISHPSVAGLVSGSGTSGTTGWNNAVRSRMYFMRIDEDDDDEQDDRRVLKVMKANYAPRGDSVLVTYQDGVFAKPPAKADYDRQKEEQEHDAIFLKLLRRFTEQGRKVSPNPSKTYAPTVFMDEPEAKKRKRKVTKDQLAEAMRRLFAAQKIGVTATGPASRRYDFIIERGASGQLALGPSNASSNDPPTPPSNSPFERPISGKQFEPSQKFNTGGLRTPSNAQLRTPPHTPPHPAEGFGDGASNGSVAPESAPPVQKQSGFQKVTSPAPNEACVHCGKKDGMVYLIRDAFRGVRSYPLHEHCAPVWFEKESNR